MTQAPLSGHAPYRLLAWWAIIAGSTGLASLAGAYWFTYEPAPAIRVLWQQDVSAPRQQELERRYLLSNRRAPHPDEPRSLAYDLLDTRRSNIEALVKDPDVADTNDVDRQYFEIRLDRASGERWMWVAHRMPVLRDARIRWSLIVLLAAMVTFGVRSVARAERGSEAGRRLHSGT